MKIDDVGVIADLRMRWINAHRVRTDLCRENITISMYINGFDVTTASNTDRELSRKVALGVWDEHISELRAKLMLLGVEP